MRSESKKRSDNRKHPRYGVELGSFAVFRRDISVLPGPIVDVSMSGLSFFYYDSEEWPQDSGELYALFGDTCNVENISMQVVYDTEVLDQGHPVYTLLAEQYPDQLKIRRRGVKFGALDAGQKENLAALIQEFHAAQKE